MGRNRPKGTTQLNLDLDTDLVGTVREFADSRGETLRAVVEKAIRRHLAYPPPTPAEMPPEPFPDAIPAAAVRPRGKRK